MDAYQLQYSVLPQSLKLGELLVSAGLLSPHQLQHTLKNAAKDCKLGQALEERKLLSPIVKQLMLNLQEQLRSGEVHLNADGTLPDKLKLELGQLLVEQGHISSEQLQIALQSQKSTGLPLGELLVRQKLIDCRTLMDSLKLQKQLRKAATMALLALCITPAHADEQAQSASIWGSLATNQAASLSTAHSSFERFSSHSAKPGQFSLEEGTFGELASSEDGSMTLKVTHTGLEFKKHF